MQKSKKSNISFFKNEFLGMIYSSICAENLAMPFAKNTDRTALCSDFLSYYDYKSSNKQLQIFGNIILEFLIFANDNFDNSTSSIKLLKLYDDFYKFKIVDNVNDEKELIAVSALIWIFFQKFFRKKNFFRKDSILQLEKFDCSKLSIYNNNVSASALLIFYFFLYYYNYKNVENCLVRAKNKVFDFTKNFSNFDVNNDKYYLEVINIISTFALNRPNDISNSVIECMKNSNDIVLSGYLSGIFYGLNYFGENVPNHWKNFLDNIDNFSDLSNKLYAKWHGF